MKEVTKELENLICDISVDTNVILEGFRNSGKARTLEALTMTFHVQHLLQARENIQSTKTRISVLSCINKFDHLFNNEIGCLPEDALIVIANFKYPDEKDFITDGIFERIILDCMCICKNRDEFKQALAKSIKQEFSQENSNHNSFYYKLSYNESCYIELLDALFTLPYDLLKVWQESLRPEELKVYEACIIRLKSLIQDSSILKDLRYCFYQIIIKYAKQKCNNVIDDFKQLGAHIEKITDLYGRITVVFDVTRAEQDLTKLAKIVNKIEQDFELYTIFTNRDRFYLICLRGK